MFESAIPEMSDEDSDLVVEYATETLLHYDKRNGDKIKPKKYEVVDDNNQVIDADTYIDELMKPSESPTPTPVVVMPQDPTGEAEISGTPEEDNPDDGITYTSFEECLGLNNATITYVGYDICDFYPNDSNGYFVMDAADNCKLLVAKFDLKNELDDVNSVDVNGAGIKFSFSVNGKTKNALTTLLLNDLAFFKEDLEPQSNNEVVVVAEIKEEDAIDVSSLLLIAKTDLGKVTFDLMQ